MTPIATNLLALRSQNSLSKASSAMQTAIERLASGLRVNSAKDDAAGMAIANRLTSQHVGLMAGSRNANDGISMSQTAHGALDIINDRLQRIRELAVQGLNGTYSGESGDKIQAEINQNLKEINRLNKEASFNGIPLLDGSAGTKTLQVGSQDGQTLSVDLNPPGFSVKELGLEALTVQGIPDTVTPVNELTVQAERIPLDSPNTTTTFHPPDNSPNIVDVLRGQSRDVIQLGGGGGQLMEMRVNAAHDTGTVANNIEIQVEDPTVVSTAAEWINSRNYLDENGNVLILSNPQIVKSGGKYWIQHDDNGSKSYLEAELTFQGGENSVVAQAKSGVAINSADMPGPISTMNYAPWISKASSTYSLTLDGTDESANTSLNLVYLGGFYYIQEETSPGQFSYYYTDTKIKTDGTQNSITVTADRSLTLAVQDEPYVTGDSTVHLQPANNNVTINYKDASGRLYTDVMQSDQNGSYLLDLNTSTNGNTSNKTARLVMNSDGAFRLQTLNGPAEVALYYQMLPLTYYTAKTDVVNNKTVITFQETGEPERLRTPANPLAAIDKAISRIDQKRSELGALDNRLDSVIQGNTVIMGNLAHARSRIMDADYAVEVANMSKSQLLQQAGTSVLAQANQIPQGVLSLLR